MREKVMKAFRRGCSLARLEEIRERGFDAFIRIDGSVGNEENACDGNTTGNERGEGEEGVVVR